MHLCNPQSGFSYSRTINAKQLDCPSLVPRLSVCGEEARAVQAATAAAVVVSGEECPSVISPPTPVSVLRLQKMLGERLEHLDLDVVFLEDSESATADHSHQDSRNTTAYIFFWLIAIEAMGQCDSEVRMYMGY